MKIIAYVYKDGLWYKEYASGRLEVCTIEETAKIDGEDNTKIEDNAIHQN